MQSKEQPAERILLAEDNPVNRDVALAMLKKLGSRARNREKMNELLSRLPRRYDEAAKNIKHGSD